MKKAIVCFSFALLMFAFALIVGLGSKQNGADTSANLGEAALPIQPPVVVPPEQLSQFKGMSVYKKQPLKKDPLWINPPDNFTTPPDEESRKFDGVM